MKYLADVDEKGNQLIRYRKLPSECQKELARIKETIHIDKWDKRANLNVKEKLISTSRSNYEIPCMLVWNEIELKL
jgi:uncharacterized protein YxjI